MKNKTKKILIIALSVMLIGLIGAMGAIFGRTDWNNLKNKVNELTQQEEVIETNNVLKNSDFSINTTGVDYFDESIIVNSDVFNNFIDDWKILSYETSDTRDFTIYQTDDGLYVRNDGTQSFWLLQTIDEGIVKYADKEMTISFSVNDVIYTTTGILTDSNSLTVESSGFGNAALTINIEQNACRASLKVENGTNATINWIQVEEGNVFTGYKG